MYIICIWYIHVFVILQIQCMGVYIYIRIWTIKCVYSVKSLCSAKRKKIANPEQLFRLLAHISRTYTIHVRTCMFRQDSPQSSGTKRCSWTDQRNLRPWYTTSKEKAKRVEQCSSNPDDVIIMDAYYTMQGSSRNVTVYVRTYTCMYVHVYSYVLTCSCTGTCK